MMYALVVLLVILLISGMPVSFAIGLSSITIIHLCNLTSLTNVSQLMFSSLDSYVLVSLPFFILAGAIMTRGLLAKYVFEFAESILCFIPGGLGAATLLTCIIFAAISGSSLANAAVIGMVAMPILNKQLYPTKFSSALIASGGTLGILIPPSITMILFGSLTEESVGKLFMAGVLPGILLGSSLCIMAVIISKMKNYGGNIKRVDYKLASNRLIKALPILVMPLIILGGIYSGVFTPTEAAVVASVYGLIIALILFRTINFIDLMKIFAEGARLSGMIFFIVMSAMLFGFIVTMEQVPQKLIHFVMTYDLSPWLLLLFLNFLLLFMGCFLDVVSCMLITVPIIYPLFKAIGINPYHLAVVYTINMEIATITPPVGMNLFVLSGVAKIPIETIIKGLLPFFILLLMGLILITYVPIITTWIPGLM